MDALPIETKARQAGLKKILIQQQTEVSNIKKELAGLRKAAISADKVRRLEIQKQAHELIKQGIEHEHAVKWVRNIAFGTLGLAGLAKGASPLHTISGH